MKRLSLSKFLLLLLMLPLIWSCKKEKNEPDVFNTPTAELRQASLEAAISGSFTDSFIIYEGSEYPDEGITGLYDLNENNLIIQSSRITTFTLMFQFIAGIPSLEVGVYNLVVGEDESVGIYSNGSIPTGPLTLNTGILNITEVESVPASLAGANARYVSGNFFFNMVDDDAGTSVEAEGSFTDVLVLMY